MFINLGAVNKVERKETNKTRVNEALGVVKHFETQYKNVNGKTKQFNRAKAEEIVWGLLKDGFESQELKDMIDFVLLSGQTRIDKEKFGLGTFLFADWVDYIDDNIEAYLNGEFKTETVTQTRSTNSTINRHREWSRVDRGGIKFNLPRYQ